MNLRACGAANLPEHMECACLPALLSVPKTSESGSRLNALHTLRDAAYGPRPLPGRILSALAFRVCLFASPSLALRASVKRFGCAAALRFCVKTKAGHFGTRMKILKTAFFRLRDLHTHFWDDRSIPGCVTLLSQRNPVTLLGMHSNALECAVEFVSRPRSLDGSAEREPTEHCTY